jgi:xylulokinase
VSREACTLGIDLGTRSVKAMFLARDGRVLGLTSAQYAVDAPRHGWAESSPEEWWEAVTQAVRALIDSCPDAEICGIGLSGQMHGVVLCDADSRPLRPAILWADQRTRDEVDAFRHLAEPLRRSLGNPLATGMAGPICLWLARHEPDVLSAARWALQPKDWLRLRLTGVAGSDHSDASATLLYDIETQDWASPVLSAIGLDPALMPPIGSSGSRAGELRAAAADALGLRAGLPVAHGGADTPCAALGLGLVEPGQVLLTVGTGAQLFAPTAGALPHPRVLTHTFRSTVEAGWYAMAAVQNAGLALEWVLAALGTTWESAYEALDATLPGAGGVTFLPYLSGERTPLMNPDIRGGWSGVGLEHDRRHLLRAALEGVAFALRHAMAALSDLDVDAPELLVAGGGSTHPQWRALLADVLGRPLRGTEVNAASARGAALLGQVAIGWFADVAETRAAAPQAGLVIVPDRTLRPGYEAAYETFINRTLAATGT